MKPSFPTPMHHASGILLASLVLPGLAALASLSPLLAAADNAPEQTTIAIKYGTYDDSQAGWDRVSVKAPHIYVQAPIGGERALEGAWVGDSVSGATPRWHSQKSGASRMSDYRSASDLKVTRYFARAAVSASVAYSDEHDYTSKAFGVDARWSSEDNNRTWTVGYGTSNDHIDNSLTIGTAIDKHKRTHELMAGVTQTLTPADIAQFNLTRGVGSGYFTDPYKLFDKRPEQRNTWIALARWNHHIAQFDAAIHSSYRYYSDTFGVKAHTFGLEWVQPIGKWTFTPGMRYHSQSAANFYFDAVQDAQGQYDPAASLAPTAGMTYTSADQRLSAFGAVTLSLKASYAITPNTVVDVKLENYRQASALHLGGSGSPGLDTFRANFTQVGLTHRF